MNKRIVLIIVLSLLFVFWLLCVGFPRHMGNSYSSVKRSNSVQEGIFMIFMLQNII